MKHLIQAALIVLVLTMAGGRWWTQRALGSLTIEQKARLLDASSRGKVWPLVGTAVAVALITWFPPRFLPVAYVPGVYGTLFMSLFLISVAATVTDVMRVLRLGLPQTYTRAVTLRAGLYLFALLLFVGALIVDGWRYAQRREHATQSSNQAMQRTASKPAIDVLDVCHPSFGCESRFTGLAVADLVSR